MLAFGFSAGLPLLLIFSSLSLWLREAGVQRASVTFFSWAALGYSFKFVWAPLVDQIPIPFLTRVLGRRRSWILAAQIGVILAILWMAWIDPVSGPRSLAFMAAAAVMLGFSSATQDIVIDAYRIESASIELQALMASSYIAGYRTGMLAAGAGALFLAERFGSSMGNYDFSAWHLTYCIMAGMMLVGVVTTCIVSEPRRTEKGKTAYSPADYLGAILVFLVGTAGFVLTFVFSSGPGSHAKAALGQVSGNLDLARGVVEFLRLGAGLVAAGLAGTLAMKTGWVNERMIRETYVAPIQDFFRRYGISLACLMLSLIGLYRISDIVLGVISNVFYQDLGFSKIQIAAIVKTFGLFMTIAGGFFGGILALRFGVMKILFAGAVLSSLTNVLFMVLAKTGPSLPLLYLVISADNLAAGLASAAFVAFLSSLTSIRFTAVQYAVFSSLMTLIPKGFGGYAGTMVDSLGYPAFFLITALMGMPVLVLIWFSGRRLDLKNPGI